MLRIGVRRCMISTFQSTATLRPPVASSSSYSSSSSAAAVSSSAFVTRRHIHSQPIECISNYTPTYNPDASRLEGHHGVSSTFSGTHEFDGDSGEFVPKEVSIHDRRQTQLSDSHKEAARYADFDGDHKSAPFLSGYSAADAKRHARDGVKAIESQTDEAIEVAENDRD